MAPPTLNPIPVYEYSPDADSVGTTPDRFLYSNLPNVRGGWENKGVAFNAFEEDYPGVVPVYRYQAQNPQRFQYTSEENPGFDEGWAKDGTAFYAFKSPQPNTVPLYRYSATNPQRGRYSKADNLGNTPWTKEGKAFYVLP